MRELCSDTGVSSLSISTCLTLNLVNTVNIFSKIHMVFPAVFLGPAKGSGTRNLHCERESQGVLARQSGINGLG